MFFCEACVPREGGAGGGVSGGGSRAFKKKNQYIYQCYLASPTRCTGSKLLQSFLWRTEMMPNWPGENGRAQNNGVIDEHWKEGVLCGLLT